MLFCYHRRASVKAGKKDHFVCPCSTGMSWTGSLAGMGLGVRARGPPTDQPADSGVEELAVTASGVISKVPGKE